MARFYCRQINIWFYQGGLNQLCQPECEVGFDFTFDNLLVWITPELNPLVIPLQKVLKIRVHNSIEFKTAYENPNPIM